MVYQAGVLGLEVHCLMVKVSNTFIFSLTDSSLTNNCPLVNAYILLQTDWGTHGQDLHLFSMTARILGVISFLVIITSIWVTGRSTDTQNILRSTTIHTCWKFFRLSEAPPTNFWMTDRNMSGHFYLVSATTNWVTDRRKCGCYWYEADTITELASRYLGGSCCMVTIPSIEVTGLGETHGVLGCLVSITSIGVTDRSMDIYGFISLTTNLN